MDYNSNRKKLILPEYGRNIQQMVDFALTVEDREERNRVVKSIIAIMGNLFPHLRDVNDFKHKLWDHITIMSDFKLEIDSPYETLTVAKLRERPEKLPYKNQRIKLRHYGKTIENLIEKAIELEDPKQKEALTALICSHMKKSFINWNKDYVADEKIFIDLKRLSDGQLEAPESIQLREHNKDYKKKKKFTKGDYKKHPKK